MKRLDPILLERVTLGYLVLPWFIFLSGWLKWGIAGGLSILLGVLLAREWGDLRKQRLHGLTQPAVEFTWPQAALVFLVVVYIAAHSGAGWSIQTWDWNKHNSVLFDLITLPWPVGYSPNAGGEGYTLVYYLAYYLPAAVVGKLWGWQAANGFLSFYTFVGLMLATLWFSHHVRRLNVAAPLVFLFFSGMNILGWLLFRPSIETGVFFGHWSHLGGFVSPLSQLMFAPQHGLSGWLFTSVILQRVIDRRMEGVVFPVALSILWSPFIALGLLPLAGYGVWVSKRIRLLLSVRTAGALLIGLVAALFLFSARSKPELQSSFPSILAHRRWLEIFVFYVSEFGACYGVLLWIWRGSRNPDRVFQGATGVCALGLVLVTFFRLGLFNDLWMRASLPGLFVLSIAAGRELVKRPRFGSLRVLALWVIFALGAPAGVQLTSFASRGFNWHMREQKWVHHLPEGDPVIVRQYFGKTDAFFFTWLARPIRF